MEMRFDLMSDLELEIYLRHLGGASTGLSAGMDMPTPRIPPNRVTSVSPTTPRAVPEVSQLGSMAQEDENTSPLFPPSPSSRAVQSEVFDHPLRVLSRAVRELKEAIERLEEENERLRAPVGPQADQVCPLASR